MPRRTPPRAALARPALLALLLVALLTGLVAGCAAPLERRTAADRTTPPKLGACYVLTPQDTGRPSSDATAVPCTEPHTAQTFAIGTLPESTGSSYTAAGHGEYVYDTCTKSFRRFLGLDESMALRVRLSWSWFRASERGWESGARWFRCDLVGGPEDASRYLALPTTAQGMFSRKPPEAWLTCARGRTVLRSQKVSCTQAHDWRAVTTIKLGGPQDPYPGDRLVQVRSRDFCSDSVGAWLNYPVDYEYGFTWFHEAEWQAGNRRSVCWAKTPR